MDKKAVQIQIDNQIKSEKKTCAFTGHRHLEEDFSKEKLINAVEEQIKQGVEIFYNGMAIGFDLLSAQAVILLKKKYPNIKLVACVPFYGQEQRFSKEQKEVYVEVLKRADEKVVLAEHYYQGCMQNRNRYMCDRADVLIAYCKKEKGGAAHTVGYFQKKYPQKEIIFL